MCANCSCSPLHDFYNLCTPRDLHTQFELPLKMRTPAENIHLEIIYPFQSCNQILFCVSINCDYKCYVFYNLLKSCYIASHICIIISLRLKKCKVIEILWKQFFFINHNVMDCFSVLPPTNNKYNLMFFV